MGGKKRTVSPKAAPAPATKGQKKPSVKGGKNAGMHDAPPAVATAVVASAPAAPPALAVVAAAPAAAPAVQVVAAAQAPPLAAFVPAAVGGAAPPRVAIPPANETGLETACRIFGFKGWLFLVFL